MRAFVMCACVVFACVRAWDVRCVVCACVVCVCDVWCACGVYMHSLSCHITSACAYYWFAWSLVWRPHLASLPSPLNSPPLSEDASALSVLMDFSSLDSL